MELESATAPFTGLLGGLFLGLSYVDFAIPIGLGLWIALLQFRMSKVDCSDPFSAAVYVAYCIFAGVVLVVVVPAKWIGDIGFGASLTWVIFFAVISSLRWGQAYVQQEKEKTIVKIKKNED